MISTASHPITTENTITSMLIAMAITTQVQSSTTPGGAGPSGGGGPPGGGGGAPGGGGGTPGGGGGGNPMQPAIGDGKPMGALPTIFEGDRSKAESFLQFSKNSPLTSSLTMMSQHLPHLSKELLSPSLASKDQRSTDVPSSSSNG